MTTPEFYAIMQSFHSRMNEQNIKVNTQKYSLCQIEFINGLAAGGAEIKPIFLTLAVAGRSIALVLKQS
jgi:hypothetical protein